ncbi:hypothetical protein [Flavobacterium sp. 7A]|uniref:hypothetical protein n=1 Tax=Flavobacterium sp. 7A TaxID=2940571 RepID=UPI0022277718|nr:hypothetical protein [Flavobacterium sp. 7A]MCW2118880.1 hypothetical protein [Flavobacterium sp. 7A]
MKVVQITMLVVGVAQVERKGIEFYISIKNGTLQKKEEYLIESCLYSIYDNKIVKKVTSEIMYKITNDGKVPYYLVVNKLNSTISKTI